jgi:tRNA(Leu) C34 or U34 (ribose-2'-O)-methylase TrmL
VLAVCRSTEALGIGSLGVISDAGLAFKQSGRTSGGAVKWTNLEQWRSTEDAIREVKARGYRVLTTVFEGGHPLEHYDWTVPTAVVLGNERDGVSDEAKRLADGGVYISMNGFTESLNVSVASSMIMHHAVQDRTRRLGSHGNLSEREKETLRAVYLARLVPRYQKHGYLRQLLERAERDSETAALEEEEEDEDDEEERCEETDDEVFLLNALEVAKIVKRPRKKKFGRPVKDDHARIMTEVETVRADA